MLPDPSLYKNLKCQKKKFRHKMKFHEQVVVLVFVLSVVGDIGSFINTAWSRNELSSQNSALLIPGADAFAKLIVNI